MATLHRTSDAGHVQVYVKGAADVLLDRCARLAAAEPVPLTPEHRRTVEEQIERLARRGLRVLALAARRVPAADVADPGSVVHRLTLLGLVGIADPPRPEARAAIALCARAGWR
jgi:Ca2+-transporting ATPase